MCRMRFSISGESVRWEISPSLACKYKNDILQKSAQNLSEKDWIFFILIMRTDIYFCKPPVPQSAWSALWSSIGQVHYIFRWLFYVLYIKSLWTSLKQNYSQFNLQNVMRTRKKQCHHHLGYIALLVRIWVSVDDVTTSPALLSVHVFFFQDWNCVELNFANHHFSWWVWTTTTGNKAVWGYQLLSPYKIVLAHSYQAHAWLWWTANLCSWQWDRWVGTCLDLFISVLEFDAAELRQTNKE